MFRIALRNILLMLGVALPMILLALPRGWPPRTMRLVILATSLALGAVIVGYVASVSTRERGWALAVALLPSAIAYGVLAKPLRSQLQK